MAFTKSMPNSHQLDDFINAGMNVLFEGRQGVGKTSIVKEAFSRNFAYIDEEGNSLPGRINHEWLYFSAATLDPWADLVGIPRPVEMIINGEKKEVLDFVRPRCLALASVRGIMFDELNRAHKKVRNAVMELLQFGTINGEPMPNLEVVWAAINPEDDDELEFDVEALDPAQKDRFEVHIEIPYKPDLNYLSGKYGRSTGKSVCNWWKDIPDKIKLEVSPRRLEYAIIAYNKGINLRNVLPTNANIEKLYKALNSGIPDEKFTEFLKNKDTENARKWLSIENNFTAVQKRIINESEARKFALPLLDAERIVSLVSSEPKIKEEVLSEPHNHVDILRMIADGSQNIHFRKQVKQILDSLPEDGPEPVHEITLDISDLPDTLSNKRREALYTETCIADKGYTVNDNKNEFEGDFERGIRKVAHFCRTAGQSTYSRKRIVEEVAPFITKDPMTKEEAIACLRILELFTSRSHPNTVLANPDFHILINTVIHKMKDTDKDLTTEKLFKICPNIFYMYFEHNGAIGHKNYKKVIKELIIQPIDPSNIKSEDDELEEMKI